MYIRKRRYAGISRWFKNSFLDDMRMQTIRKVELLYHIGYYFQENKYKPMILFS